MIPNGLEQPQRDASFELRKKAFLNEVALKDDEKLIAGVMRLTEEKGLCYL